MNKILFKALLVLGIIVSVSLITAFSCNKAGDDKNNANNSGGGGGGGGNGGPTETIKFENFDTSVAELVGGTIQLKAGGFPRKIAADLGSDINVMKTVRATSFKRAFDITITTTSGGNDAKEGLVLVGPGNLANANAFSISQGVAKGLNDYKTAGSDLKEGIVSDTATGTATANGFLQAGWNILTPFMNDTAPTTDATAAAGASPFAFTATGGNEVTQPILVCRTTLSAVTSDAAVLATTKLTGSETASCYVSALGAPFIGGGAETWLNTDAGNTFKKKFNIAVAGIKTDNKTIAGTTGIGLPGDNDTAKVDAFKDGISAAEMTKIATANSAAYTNVPIEVVRGGFTHTPLSITIGGFATGVSTNAAHAVTIGGKVIQAIEIDASDFTFPTVAAAAVYTASPEPNLPSLANAPAGSLLPIFDIAIKDGYVGNVTGGLVMTHAGFNTTADEFIALGSGVTASTPNLATVGLYSGRGTNAADGGTGEFQKPGWNVYGVFMQNNLPTQPVTMDPNAYPYIFHPVSVNMSTSQPFVFCRTTLPQFQTTTVTGSETLAGGQTARCYIGAKGEPFTGQAVQDWLNDTGTFSKKKFRIAIAAFRTEDEDVNHIIGASAFENGLDQTELQALMRRFPHTVKRVDLTIVP